MVLTGSAHRPVLAGLVVAAAAAAALLAGRSDAGQPELRTVEIVAERFTFTPAEIRVQEGTPLVLLIRSQDVAHGFRIVGAGVDVEVPARGRGTIMVPFSAPPGRYDFECSIVCGAGHGYMRGSIVVTGEEEAR